MLFSPCCQNELSMPALTHTSSTNTTVVTSASASHTARHCLLFSNTTAQNTQTAHSLHQTQCNYAHIRYRFSCLPSACSCHRWASHINPHLIWPEKHLMSQHGFNPFSPSSFNTLLCLQHQLRCQDVVACCHGVDMQLLGYSECFV